MNFIWNWVIYSKKNVQCFFLSGQSFLVNSMPLYAVCTWCPRFSYVAHSTYIVLHSVLQLSAEHSFNKFLLLKARLPWQLTYHSCMHADILHFYSSFDLILSYPYLHNYSRLSEWTHELYSWITYAANILEWLVQFQLESNQGSIVVRKRMVLIEMWIFLCLCKIMNVQTVHTLQRVLWLQS